MWRVQSIEWERNCHVIRGPEFPLSLWKSSPSTDGCSQLTWSYSVFQCHWEHLTLPAACWCSQPVATADTCWPCPLRTMERSFFKFKYFFYPQQVDVIPSASKTQNSWATETKNARENCLLRISNVPLCWRQLEGHTSLMLTADLPAPPTNPTEKSMCCTFS